MRLAEIRGTLRGVPERDDINTRDAKPTEVSETVRTCL